MRTTVWLWAQILFKYILPNWYQRTANDCLKRKKNIWKIRSKWIKKFISNHSLLGDQIYTIYLHDGAINAAFWWGAHFYSSQQSNVVVSGVIPDICFYFTVITMACLRIFRNNSKPIYFKGKLVLCLDILFGSRVWIKLKVVVLVLFCSCRQCVLLTFLFTSIFKPE